MWVRIPLETYIFILDFSLPPRSEQVNGAVANEIKHVHSPEVIVVLDPRYDLSYKALYISTCSIALTRTATLYSTISASIILFKLVFGIMIDYENKCCMFEPFKLCIIFVFVGGMSSLALPWITDFTGLVIFSTVFGASFACMGGALTPTILIRLYGGKGLDQLGLTYRVVMIYLGVGYVLGSPAAGNVLLSILLLLIYHNSQSDIYTECAF